MSLRGAESSATKRISVRHLCRIATRLSDSHNVQIAKLSERGRNPRQQSSLLNNVENFDDKTVSSVSKKFEQVSNNATLKTVEKTAGLPRSQGYLLPRNDMGKRAAFTLAEVLITLGIIGVVAAMTLPALIQNYQKGVALTRFKKAYSVMAQALTRAQADYGDTNLWENLSIDEAANANQAIVKQNVEKYILPYMTNVMNSGVTTLGELGYNVYETIGGNKNTNLNTVSKQYYIIELADSITYYFVRGSSDSLIIYIDIDGGKRNNIWGKDAFIFRINKLTGKFEPYRSGDFSFQRSKSVCYDIADGRTCAALIIENGWEIPKDYPIKF